MTNDKERGLLNGEIGIVTVVSDERMIVQFDGRKVAYQKSALTRNREHGPTNHLDWANVITVHKAQASEFSAVIVPVTGAYSLMLLRNLYYTGVSRGRNKVIILDEPEALEKAARNLRGTHRITKLAEFLNPQLDLARAGSGYGRCQLPRIGAKIGRRRGRGIFSGRRKKGG
jgi:exodeoxyribonuclease V alpha subunit